MSDVDYMDPATMNYTTSWFLARGILRTLVTHPSKDAANDELVPDLAIAMAEPRRNLTQWTYRIKSDVSWGPALGGRRVEGVTGEEIVCDDFKYAFERAFLPSVGGVYASFFEVLQGAKRFASGDVKHIKGVKCPGEKMIVFRLSEPTGDWPFRLSLPASSPVPHSFAARHDQKKSSSFGQHFVASGPYFVNRWQPNQLIQLERSPQWSPTTDAVRRAYVDRVRWRIGFENDLAVKKVQTGDYDLGLDVYPRGPTLEEMMQDTSVPRNLISRVTQCTQFIFLNSTVKPFDDVRVREAVNVTIDRAHLARLMGGEAAGDIATSILPPGLGGHLPPDQLNPFATKGMQGDVERGRKLLSEAGYKEGYDDEVLLVGASDPPFDRVTESIRRDLERLGFSNIEVKLPAFPNNYTQFYSVPSRNTAVGTSAGWCKAYQDAFTFFDPLFHGDSILQAGNQNFGELDDPELNAAIDRAAGLPPGVSRDAAWEDVNAMATRSAVWVPWMWPRVNIIHGDELVGPVYLSLISHLDWVNVGVDRRD